MKTLEQKHEWFKQADPELVVKAIQFFFKNKENFSQYSSEDKLEAIHDICEHFNFKIKELEKALGSVS